METLHEDFHLRFGKDHTRLEHLQEFALLESLKVPFLRPAEDVVFDVRSDNAALERHKGRYLRKQGIRRTFVTLEALQQWDLEPVAP